MQHIDKLFRLIIVRVCSSKRLQNKQAQQESGEANRLHLARFIRFDQNAIKKLD